MPTRSPTFSLGRERHCKSAEAVSAGSDGVEEACVAELCGVLRELDIGPGDDIAERLVLEGPAGPLYRVHVAAGELLEPGSPLTLKLADPLADAVGGARPQHVKEPRNTEPARPPPGQPA